jgi:DNA-binding MarR family transcriptional regulator
MKYNKDMKEQALQNNLYWQFLQASFRAKKAFIKLAEEHDLTFVQLYTLCSMEPGKPLPMHEIASMLNCDASNVTGIIDRLFSDRYIERQEKPEDRRVKMISLTTEGIKLREQIIDKILALQPKSFDGLSSQQKDALRDMLEQILRPT